MVDTTEDVIERVSDDSTETQPVEQQSSDEPTCTSGSKVVKAQRLSVWNSDDKVWTDCIVSYTRSVLTVTKYQELERQTVDLQLKHLSESWYHGSIGRRESRHVLFDFKGGHCSFLVRLSQTWTGKFAISVLYHRRVLHIMITTSIDPVTKSPVHSVYQDGPYFNSLYELVERCRKEPHIKHFDYVITLGRVARKYERLWFDTKPQWHSEAADTLSKDQRDGAFFVYKMDEFTDVYSICYRSGGQVHRTNILPGVRQNVSGYSLQNVFSPVMYKVVHYFMENPIQGNTVLMYPVTRIKNKASLCGLSLHPSLPPDLEFPVGALVRNIHRLGYSTTRCVGDYGDQVQQAFQSSCVRFLSPTEQTYFDTARKHSDVIPKLNEQSTNGTFVSKEKKDLNLDLSTDYWIRDYTKETSKSIVIYHRKEGKNSTHYCIRFSTAEDFASWSNVLNEHKYQNNKKNKCVIN